MLKELKDLNKEIKECKKCRLYDTRENALCGEGNLSARLMLVAQAPGEKENQEGKMFIGPSGKKLDELLDEVGVCRDEIYMTNLVKCMLPKYRRPKEDEIQACAQYLGKEIEIINPKVIAPLGYYSTKYIFEKYKIPLPNPKPEFSEVYGKIFQVVSQATLLLFRVRYYHCNIQPLYSMIIQRKR